MCMSSRQPASSRATPLMQASLSKPANVGLIPALATKKSQWKSNFNFKDSMRLQSFQKLRCLDQIEFFVSCFHHKEKTVFRRKRESCHVKYRMIRRWQPVHGQHAKNCAKGCAKNGQLERN